MNNELLLSLKKHTDKLIEQTKTKPQETPEFKMNEQMQNFFFSRQIILSEEGNLLLGVSSFECTNSVFNTTNQNNSFSTTTPGHWSSESAEKLLTN